MPEASARRPASMAKMIDAFARLFVDVDSSRVPVDRAEMDATVIAFDPRALINWTNIVNEAIRQNKLRELVTAADEMYPNNPELKNGLRDYEQWAAQNASTPEVVQKLAEQLPPHWWEIWRHRVIGWTLIVLGTFVIIGTVARQSQHIFYGLPIAREHHLLRDPKAWAFDGLKFFARTLIVALEYLTLNPLGAVATVVAFVLLIYILVRWRKSLERVYQPVIIVPLLIVIAIAKSLWYDVPTMKFENVLKTNSVYITNFDIPPLFQSRANTIWTSVVCSRIANFGGSEVQSICGKAPARDYLQNVYGRFLLDVLFTIALWSLGVRVVRKLLLPSRELAWNLPPIWRRTSLIGVGIALLIAILGVPFAYSRTARSMKPPKVCAGSGDCYFRLCITADNCYDYAPADAEIVPSEPIPPRAQITTEDDVLQASFAEQLQGTIVNPPDRANRFPGGMR